MEDTRRKALEEELADVESQLAELSAAATYLRKRLGRPEAPADPADAATPTVTIGASGNGLPSPSLAVTPGEYFGFSATKASHSLLEKVGRSRPLSTREIFDAIRKGGVSIAKPTTLYKSLARDPKFYKPSRGMWGLTAWYPASARKSRPDGSSAAEDEDVGEDEGPATSTEP